MYLTALSPQNTFTAITKPRFGTVWLARYKEHSLPANTPDGPNGPTRSGRVMEVVPQRAQTFSSRDFDPNPEAPVVIYIVTSPHTKGNGLRHAMNLIRRLRNKSLNSREQTFFKDAKTTLAGIAARATNPPPKYATPQFTLDAQPTVKAPKKKTVRVGRGRKRNPLQA